MTTFNEGTLFLLVLLFCSGLMFCQSQRGDDLNSRLENVLLFSTDQVKIAANAVNDSTKFPRSGEPDGTWNTTPSKGWTSGFFPGLAWYLYEYSKDDTLLSIARRWTAGMTPEQFNTRTHDVGFMMYCSYGNGLRLTGNKSYEKILMNSANSLISRFKPVTGCIKSWDWMDNKYPVIIDNMMNLELLFWASKHSGDRKYYDIAVKHAETTMINQFRDDNSTWHVIIYDTTSGMVKERITHQGYSDESAWTRGQAWGIHGYTTTYRETGDQRFLNTAVKAADYYLSRLPDDMIPYWDFDAPNIPDEVRDASAAAITASALIELSTLVDDSLVGKKYFESAKKILFNLSSSNYLAKNSGYQSILLHSTGSKPNKSEVDVPIIYADYYFIEAILRYRKLTGAN